MTTRNVTRNGARPRQSLHTIVALVEDQPGVLNRVASLFRRRGFNIESLAVGHTETPGISRMTLVVDGAKTVIEQVEKQLYKLIDVVKVADITHDPIVARELALVKVRCNTRSRSEIIQIAQVFRADVVDVAETSLIIQVAGGEDKVDAFLQAVKPYGIREVVRTGRIALTRGAVGDTAVTEVEPQDVREFHAHAGRRPKGALPYVSD
ncbi:MAG TPA: acetolactate synthase small subunit [Dehalococcoidia bacterium]|nr:acetolactate synthase small subunit [Dehalococcoidia bacterium]